ncbi:MAG: tetratricopeptide repeat protein [Bacteroidales bacterium]|nr:tetratricopeptide repeat protein [Bacteroidales bacterium]
MKDLEHLVKYLDGELSEKEKHELIEKLRNDPSLSEKVDLIKDVDEIVGDKHLSSFEESLKEVESVYFNRDLHNASVSSRKYLIFTRIAVVLFVLLSTGAYFFFTGEGNSGGQDKLFAAYYEKMPADFTTRSVFPQDDNFIKAIKYYNDNKFRAAIIEFEKILKSDPDNNSVKLFLGLCYTETNEFENAAGFFKSILKQKDPIFEEHAAWYLSLCYIKTNKFDMAKPILKKLIDSRSFYMQKASELQNKLN